MARKDSKGGARRRNAQYPGLQRQFHPKKRWEYLDQDYIDQLSPQDKEFLSKFNDEYYGASLAPVDEPKKWKKDFHKSKKRRKECQDRNNANERDIYAKGRNNGNMQPLDIPTLEQPTSTELTQEDTINELIDIKDLNNSLEIDGYHK